MNKKVIGLFTFCAFGFAANAQKHDVVPMKPEMTEFWDPEVKVVSAGKTAQDAPSDAIVLFDGSKETFEAEWENAKNSQVPKWNVKGKAMTVVKKTGAIQTKRKFNDFQLHIEWSSPKKVNGEGQGRGNSGIFLQERYEVQVLDNYNNRTYRNGQAGSIYKQTPPLVNVCREPGEWQTYDIIYTAPRFKKDGSVFSKAQVTVIQNGVLVQHNTDIEGPTVYKGIPMYTAHGKASIKLQDHSNPVSYRNIWIRDLD